MDKPETISVSWLLEWYDKWHHKKNRNPVKPCDKALRWLETFGDSVPMTMPVFKQAQQVTFGILAALIQKATGSFLACACEKCIAGKEAEYLESLIQAKKAGRIG